MLTTLNKSPFRNRSPFGAADDLTEADFRPNGFQFDLVAHFESDQYFYDSVADYTINGLQLDLAADFKTDTYASEL